MALIKCPECEKEISNQAQACIYCGYPLNNIAEKMGLFQLEILSTEENILFLIKPIRDLLGLDFNEACDFVETLPVVVMKGLSYSDAQFVENMFMDTGAKLIIKEDLESKIRSDIHRAMAEHKEEAQKVHCPICGSTDIGVVSGEIRVFDGFGGSGRAQNVCKRCGHQWIPRLLNR